MQRKLILKASAGTGKTYRLSLEYVASLASGIDFRDILVVTFTKKATAEIKERILKFLFEISKNSTEKIELENNLKKIYGESFEFDISKMKYIYNHIVENKDKLKIYTIDSFTNGIFKKAIAPYLKIYSYEIIDDFENKKYLTRTFRKIFENRDNFLLFKEFSENNTEKNMDNYISLIANLLNERWKLIFLKNQISPKQKIDVKSSYKILNHAFEILEKICEIRGNDIEGSLKKPIINYYLSNNKEKFLKDNYKLFLKEPFWNKNKTRRRVKEDNSLIDDLEFIYEELRINLAREMYNDLVIPYENSLLKTIQNIYEIYDEIKFKEKRFTHSDISLYVLKFLEDKNLGFIDENGVTKEFFEIIDGKLNTIFIDEFQDTSILQWKILKYIIDKSENIICVGDEKQSIYGWRGGEKKLFEKLPKILDGKEENLDTNYRSRENIVTFTNKFFKNISEDSLEYFDSKWNFIESNFTQKKDGNKGCVEIFKDFAEDNDIYDAIINNLEANFKGNYKEIGILARDSKTLDLIAQKLALANIPFSLESKKNIIENKGINSFIFLIKYLVKKDFLSLLEFLRSDLVNISAPALKKIIENKENLDDFFQNDSILIKIKDIVNIYEKYEGKTEFLTFELFKNLGITGVFNKNENIKNLYDFYKLIKEYKYFNDFLIDFETNPENKKFKQNSESNNGISLMTIHKSKGLEFDTVFYILASGKGNSDKGFEFFLNLDDEFSNMKDYLITDNKYKDILEVLPEFSYFEEKNLKIKQEEMNNLYVALTRPKTNLFIYIKEVNNITNSILDMNSVGTLFVEKKNINLPPDEKEVTLDFSTPETLYKLEFDENEKKAFEKIYSHTLISEYKKIKGTVIHYFLENLKNLSKSEINLAKKLTFSKYVSTLGESELLEIISDKNINYILKKCEDLFSIKWDFIFNEYPITLKTEKKDKNFRIDKLLIQKATSQNKGNILIADYKTGSYDEEQLLNYKHAVEELLKNNNIKIEDYNIKTKFIELDI